MTDVQSGHPPECLDPVPPDWSTIDLEDSWPDKLHPLTNPLNVTKLIRHLFSKRRPVELPANLFGADCVPKYALQEFHHLPNGNYSNHLSHGYITGFDIAMLGKMKSSRRWIAKCFEGCDAVLDIGTAGGKTAAEVSNRGCSDAWGMDPSPYLLKQAARRFPHINFVPGIGENIPFPDQRFDAISLCFVFHEVPPKIAQKILAECYRSLKPGGLLAIAEPSPLQFQRPRLRTLLTRTGWLHLYFYLLARQVHEPFVKAWHKINKPKWFAETGFRLVEYFDEIPTCHWLAKKPLT